MDRPPQMEEDLKAWFGRHPIIPRCAGVIFLAVMIPISITWSVAEFIKGRRPEDRSYRSKAIVVLNVGYLMFAIVTTGLLIRQFDGVVAPLRAHSGWVLSAWSWFLCSRCAEVLIAFYRDALDRLRGKQTGSDLNGPWRVVLALNSYVELVIDYALLYAILPKQMWGEGASPESFTDALWLSASTITTSGSAGFPPKHWLPQLLSTAEIVSGVILLVVCFALYAAGGNREALRRRTVDLAVTAASDE